MKHLKLYESFISESVYDEIPIVTENDIIRRDFKSRKMGKFIIDGYTIEIYYMCYTPTSLYNNSALGKKYEFMINISKKNHHIIRYYSHLIKKDNSSSEVEDLIKFCKKSKTMKEFAEYVLEYCLLHTNPKKLDPDPADVPNEIQVSYIKKKGLKYVDTLCLLVQELEKFCSVYTFGLSKTRNITPISITKALKKSDGIVDANGLTALWLLESFYIYCIPEEVFHEYNFMSADNQKCFKYKNDNGDLEYIVGVAV